MKYVLLAATLCILCLTACRQKGSGKYPTDMSSFICNEKKLSAYAETKLALQDAFMYGSQPYEDYAMRLCARYKPLFANDCQLVCAATSGMMSDILCPANDGNMIYLTEVYDNCDYLMNH